MKKAIFVAVCFLLVCFGLYGYRLTVTKIAKFNTAHVDGWKTYTDYRLEFSFMYPPNLIEDLTVGYFKMFSSSIYLLGVGERVDFNKNFKPDGVLTRINGNKIYIYERGDTIQASFYTRYKDRIVIIKVTNLEVDPFKIVKDVKKTDDENYKKVFNDVLSTLVINN